MSKEREKILLSSPNKWAKQWTSSAEQISPEDKILLDQLLTKGKECMSKKKTATTHTKFCSLRGSGVRKGMEVSVHFDGWLEVANSNSFVGQDAVKFYFQALRNSMTDDQRGTTLLVNPYMCTMLQNFAVKSITDEKMDQYFFMQHKTKPRNQWTKIIVPWVQFGHFFAIAAHPQRNVIEWCDSFNAETKVILDAADMIGTLIDIHIPPEGTKAKRRKWNVKRLASPQQSSGVDCAFFVCFNVTAMVNNIAPTQYMRSVHAVKAGRERFAVYMMKGSSYYIDGNFDSLWRYIDSAHNETRKLIFGKMNQPAPGGKPSTTCPTITFPKQIPAKYNPTAHHLQEPIQTLMKQFLLRCCSLRDKIHAFHDVLPLVFKPYIDNTETMLDSHRSVVLAFIVNEMTLIRQGIMQLTIGATYNGDVRDLTMLARDHLRNDLDNAKTFWEETFGVKNIQDVLTKNIITFGNGIGDALTQCEDARKELERTIKMKCSTLECNQTTLHYEANTGRRETSISFDAKYHSTSSTIPSGAPNNKYTSMKVGMMKNLLRGCFILDGVAPQPIFSFFDGTNELAHDGAIYIDRTDYPALADAIQCRCIEKKRKRIKYDEEEEENEIDIPGHLLFTPPKSSSTAVESNEKNAGSETTLMKRLDNNGGGDAEGDKKRDAESGANPNDEGGRKADATPTTHFSETAATTSTAVESNEKNAGSETTLMKRLDNNGGGDAEGDKKRDAESSSNPNDEEGGRKADATPTTHFSETAATTAAAITTKMKRKNDDVSEKDDRSVNGEPAAAPTATGGSNSSGKVETRASARLKESAPTSGGDAADNNDNDDDVKSGANPNEEGGRKADSTPTTHFSEIAAITAAATTTKMKRKNDDVSDNDGRSVNGEPAAAPTAAGGSNSSGKVVTRASTRLKESVPTSGGDAADNNDNDDDAESGANPNEEGGGRKADTTHTTNVCCAKDSCVLHGEAIDDAVICNNCGGTAHDKCAQDWQNGQLAKLSLRSAGKTVFEERQRGTTRSHKICFHCFNRVINKQRLAMRLKVSPPTETNTRKQSQIRDGTNNSMKGGKDARSQPTEDKDSNETVKTKRHGKSLAGFSLKDTWKSSDFQPTSVQTKNNRKSTATAKYCEWLKSFKSEKNQHHTVVPEDECSLDADKTAYFKNVGNDQRCEGNEYQLHTTPNANVFSSSLTEKSLALRKKLPKTGLRSVDIRRNSSFEPAVLFIDSVVDSIEMVDHIQNNSNVAKVFLHPNIIRSPKFFEMCKEQIPEWRNQKDREGVYFLGFIRMWVKDDVVIKFFIDAGLLFSVELGQDNGLSSVIIHQQHTHPVFCRSGLVQRLTQIANLGFGFEAQRLEGQNILVTSDTCKAIASRLECSEGLNGSSTPSDKLVRFTTTFTTSVVLNLPEVLPSPFESSSTLHPNDLTDAEVARLTAIPLAVKVHALRLLLPTKVKLTASALDVDITETLCEIYQWTEVCPLGYSKLKPLHVECRLRCRCCGQLFGQKSPLFNLLQLAPEFIAIHHDLTGVTLPGFGTVARVSSDADDKCQFGNEVICVVVGVGGGEINILLL